MGVTSGPPPLVQISVFGLACHESPFSRPPPPPPLWDADVECLPVPQRHKAAEQQIQDKKLFSAIAIGAFHCDRRGDTPNSSGSRAHSTGTTVTISHNVRHIAGTVILQPGAPLPPPTSSGGLERPPHCKPLFYYPSPPPAPATLLAIARPVCSMPDLVKLILQPCQAESTARLTHRMRGQSCNAGKHGHEQVGQSARRADLRQCGRRRARTLATRHSVG